MVARSTDATHAAIGTMFRVVIDNREYCITARHVVTGVYGDTYGRLEGPTIKVRALLTTPTGPEWKDEVFSIIDLGDQIDVLVLHTSSEPIETAADTGNVLTSEGALPGGQCGFLGFPLGLVQHVEFQGHPAAFPFVKHCSVAGHTNQPSPRWILDGINNHGFSGGPVFFWAGNQQKIMAVVSGYVNEAAPVTIAPLRPNAPNSPVQAQDTPMLVGTAQTNSGLIVAFDISVAVDAIRQNPVGPSLAAK
jgi:hypothetical protein